MSELVNTYSQTGETYDYNGRNSETDGGFTAYRIPCIEW